jgi:diguanylate cyclase (GGDEF)-like protein
VVVCDLNSFKAVNDRQGHQTGDLLLRTIAAGFLHCCRSYDTVARTGGDEFAFLLPGVGEDHCATLLEQIEETIRKACSDVKIDVAVTASIGTAFYPADGDAIEKLLGLADRRMYSDKRKHYGALVRQAILPQEIVASA